MVNSELNLTVDKQPSLNRLNSIPQTMTLTWSRVNVRLQNAEQSSSGNLAYIKSFYGGKSFKPIRRHILKDVYGVAESGQLLAILGSSGAGKSTLLNVLTQRNLGSLSVDGSVRVNGTEINGSKLRKISAYVQQEDLFVATLTVKEHLHFHANLRMGQKYTKSERRQRVEDVICELGLTNCANTMIGTATRIRGISGGERKRLAFASELLNNPTLMFCDEPTSGLDSFLAQQIILVLRQMAARGRTVVLTIHQPSSEVFSLFDRVCLLAAGRVVYLGPSRNARNIWKECGYPCPVKYNPADHYIRTLSMTGRGDTQWADRIRTIRFAYEESEIGRQTKNRAVEGPSLSTVAVSRPKKTVIYKASWLQQLRNLFWRSMLTIFREPLLLRVRLFQTILVGLLMGLVFFQTTLSGYTIMNFNGILFQLVINMNYMFQMAVVNTFCDEIPIFMREHLSGIYRVDTYYLAKMLADLPQYIVLPVLFTTIIYWMAGLYPNLVVFLTTCAILTLMANAAISISYMTSCIFGEVSVTVTIMPVLVVPLLMFAGFYINEASIPAYFHWLSYLSYFGYSFKAISINQWERVQFIPGCQYANASCPSDGDEVLQMLNFEKNEFLSCIIALFLMIILLRLFGFFALLIRTIIKK